MSRSDDVTTGDLATAAEQPAGQDPSNARVVDVEGPAPQQEESTETRRAAPASPEAAKESRPEPLLPAEDTETFNRKWEEVQVRFVDEPRSSVEEADKLVAQVMKRLAESFAAEREKLEGHWDRGDEVSTDDLRVALQRYRSFFQRLLAM
jgi:hypothetical protein